MKRSWNKEEILEVVAQLKKKTCVVYGGFHFIKAIKDSEDPFMKDIVGLVDSSGGACAAMVNREFLVDNYGPGESDIRDWIVRTSYPKISLRVVLITGSLVKDQYDERCSFVLAHEIGHHALGHTAVPDGPKPGTPEYITREIEADGFAAKALGSNKERNETLAFMREFLNQANKDAPPEMVEMVAAMIDGRIDWDK
jgi:hypothetical protein